MPSATAVNLRNWFRIAITVIGVFVLAACSSKPVGQYYGVRLGASMNAVTYALGSPSLVIDPVHLTTSISLYDVMRATHDVSEIPQGKTVNDYPEWGWETDASRVVVTFSKPHGKVIKVRCVATLNSPTSCKPLLGITIGSTEQSLKKKLGPPSQQVLHKTSYGVSKTIGYDYLHAYFALIKQKVVEIQFGKPGIPYL